MNLSFHNFERAPFAREGEDPSMIEAAENVAKNITSVEMNKMTLLIAVISWHQKHE